MIYVYKLLLCINIVNQVISYEQYLQDIIALYSPMVKLGLVNRIRWWDMEPIS